nr:DUF1186 domain-containing protein [Parendozoicomonas sp. Alg238-R29]
MNDVQQAIEVLSVYEPGVFPREALQTLIDQQEEATPLLLEYLETVAVDVQKAVDNEHTGLMLFALYLLGQFRETRAYRPLINMLGQLDETNDGFLGDLVTEGLSRIIASVCDGDIAPVQQLAQNPDADHFIRAAAFYSLGTLVLNNRLGADTLKDYCRSMLSGELQYDDDGYLPIVLVNICEMHGFADLLPVIRKAYQRWPEMKLFNKLKAIEDNLQTSEPDEHESSFHKDLITDTIGSLENWASFQPEAEDEDDFDLASLFPEPQGLQDPVGQAFLTEGTFVREEPKVGRNDPCPCGSGKKHKKCCG